MKVLGGRAKRPGPSPQTPTASEDPDPVRRFLGLEGRDPGRQAFERLVKAGCDGATLLTLFSMLKNRVGEALDQGTDRSIGRRQLTRLALDLRSVAGRLPRVWDSRFGSFFLRRTEDRRSSFEYWNPWSTLPEALTKLAEVLEAARRVPTGQHNRVRFKAHLMAYVRVYAGAWRDEDVACVIDGLGLSPKETAPGSLREWRRAHRARIEAAQEYLKDPR